MNRNNLNGLGFMYAVLGISSIGSLENGGWLDD